MAKGTEATQKKYSEMTPAEKQAYKAELQEQVKTYIGMIEDALKAGLEKENNAEKKNFTAEQTNSLLLTEEQKRSMLEKTVTDEKIEMHERAKESGLWNVREYDAKKSKIAEKYIVANLMPYEMQRIKKSLILPEEGMPENAKRNKELLPGINRDDAIGDEKRREIQLGFYQSIADLEVRSFMDEKNCTLKNFLDYGIKNYDKCLQAIDLPFVASGMSYNVKEQSRKKLKALSDYGTTMGAACKNSIVYAAYDEFLSYPCEFLNDAQKECIVRNESLLKKAGLNNPKFFGDYIQYDRMSRVTSEEARKLNAEYPNIKISSDDIESQPKTVSLGGYFPRKELMLKYCEEIGKLKNDRLAPVQKACTQISNLLKKNEILADEDIPKVRELVEKQAKELSGARSDISVKDKDNETFDKIGEILKMQKATVTMFQRPGVLQSLTAYAREDLQKQKQDLMTKLQDPKTFAKYKQKIADITQDLKSTDDFYVWTNTKKFNEMRDATYALNKRMQAVKEGGIPSEGRLEEMADMLMQVSKKADAYATAKLESIKNEMREPENSPKQRSIHRLASAMNLKRLVAEGEAHPIGKDNFKEQVGVLLNDVNERFHRYDANQPVQHDDEKTRADVEKFAVALERYIDKHPKILDNGLLAQDKVNKLKANIQSGKQKEMEDPNLGAKTRSAGGLNI